MFDPALLARAGRRVRLGMIGGGQDSVIGSTHLVAYRVDGLADLVAGAMSIDPAIAESSAAAQLVPGDRRYESWQQMLDGERNRPDRIDAVVVITPPRFHGEISEAFLRAGIHVLCEKPMAADLTQAESLAAVVGSSDAFFAVTHCYTGYPLVREARELVRSGALGRIRLVDGEFAAGDPGVLREPDDSGKRHWHFQPSAMGKAVVLGEVGSHVHNLIEFITGSRVKTVSAELHTIAERREVFDNAYLNVELADGTVGRLWSSFVAAGHDHGLRFRIYGDEGSLAWNQEEPEHLWLFRPGEPATRIARALDSTSASSRSASRIRPGHPEGYLMAFANVYRDFFEGVLKQLVGEDPRESMSLLPTADDGLSTLRLIDAAVRSHETKKRASL
jgi:predicted dehydrogenase